MGYNRSVSAASELQLTEPNRTPIKREEAVMQNITIIAKIVEPVYIVLQIVVIIKDLF